MTSRRPILIALSLSFALHACSSGGGSPADAGGPGALTPPTGLVAHASASSSSVQLSWNAEAAATGGYQIWRDIDGNDTQLDSATVNSYLDSSAPAGTSISYKVRAVQGGNVSDESTGVMVLTIPGAPTALAASSVGATSVTISWVEATGAQGGDEVSYVAGHGASVEGGATGTTYTATGLEPQTMYTFAVTARDATGNGPSAVVVVTTLLTDPVDGGAQDAGAQDAGAQDAGAQDAGTHDGGTSDAGNNDAGQSDGGGDMNDGGGAQPAGAFDLAAYGSDNLIIVQWEDQGASSYQVFRAHGAGAYTQIAQTSATTFADQGGAAHPIAAGDSYSYFVAPVDSGGNASDSSSAATAQALGIAVTESDHYVDDATTTNLAADFSSGVVSPTLGQTYAVIPSFTDGGADLNLGDSVAGFGTTAGLAVFPGVRQGPYTLVALPLEIYSTMPATTRELDLSISFPGRLTIDNESATLNFNITGLDAWDSTFDGLTALSWGAADFSLGPLEDDFETPLADGGTSFNQSLDTGSIFGDANLIQSNHGDVLYVLQTEQDTSGNSPYTAVRKGLALQGINQTSGGTSSASGAMIGTPTIGETLQFHLDPTTGVSAAAFLKYTAAVNPSATAGDITQSAPDYGAASIGAEPGYAANGAYGVTNSLIGLWYGGYSQVAPLAPRLFTGPFPSGTGDVAFGSNGIVDFTNVFPARWDLFLNTYVPFTVPLTVSGAGVVKVVARLQTQGLLSNYVTSGQAQIAARISPVTSPKINGAAASASGNAQLAAFSNASPLRFSWGAPVLGAPTRYTVSIWQVDNSGLAQIPSAVLQTTALSASLPAGRLVTSVNYVAFITATSGDADRLAGSVLAYDGSSDTADCVTSSFSVQ